MCKFILLVILIGLTTGTANLRAQGDIEAVNSAGWTGGVFSSGGIVSYVNNGTVGWAFSSSQDIVISSLGWLLAITNPPPTPSVSIGLWSDDGTLLRSVVIDSESVSINRSLYESVAPLFVPAGSTLVVGAGISGQTFNYVALSGSPTQQPINFAGTAVLSDNGFAFPTVQPTAGDTDRFIPAATFLFQTVPEPSVLGLSALGGLLLAWRRWKVRAI